MIVPKISFNIYSNKLSILETINPNEFISNDIENTDDPVIFCEKDSNCPPNHYCIINRYYNFTFCKGIFLKYNKIACPGSDETKECNINGLCSKDYAAGIDYPVDVECHCYDYFRDDDCSQCNIGYYGASCIPCPGLSNQINDKVECSGHGKCNGSGTHGGDGECKCDEHFVNYDCHDCERYYYGNDCKNQCPGIIIDESNSTKSCYGHGSCHDGVFGSGECDCFYNYNRTYNCSTCNDGYYGKDCEECPGVDRFGNICNNHGNCNNITGECECIKGYNSSTYCKTCVEGYYYNNETKSCHECPGVYNTKDNIIIPCDGHGTCNTNTNGKCVCFKGWSIGLGGDTCNTCDSSHYGKNCSECPGKIHHIDDNEDDYDNYYKYYENTHNILRKEKDIDNNNNVVYSYVNVCSGHGICEGAGTTTGSGKCLCSEGWTNDICNNCKEGYYGSNCIPCPNYPNICNGNGVCEGNGNINGSGKCRCNWQWIGSNCDFQCINILLLLYNVVYIIIIIALGVFSVFIILTVIFLLKYKKRKLRTESVYTDLLEDLISTEEKDHWLINKNEIKLGVCIAVGSTGRVLRGYYKNAPVAIKCLYSERNEKHLKAIMKSEISILTRVSHPNIIKFLGICQMNKMLLFVTEECESYNNIYIYIHRSLSMLLYQDVTPFDTQLYNQIALQICEGCLFLHNYSIIHGDLKPSNILLKDNISHEVKICDFGISHTITDSVITNGIVGTPQYMAPELLLNTSACSMLLNNNNSGNNNNSTTLQLQSSNHSNKSVSPIINPRLLSQQNISSPTIINISNNSNNNNNSGNNNNRNGFAIDVYAYGVILCEMFNQSVPFSNMNPFQIGLKVLNGERPQISSNCPVKLKELIENCWKTNPNERPTFEHIRVEILKDVFNGEIKDLRINNQI